MAQKTSERSEPLAAPNRIILATASYCMHPEHFQKSSGFLSTKPARVFSKEDLMIGTHPRLFNKDRTRYGGLTVIPEHLLAIEDDDKREALIDNFVATMDAKPLTDEEKQQKDEWDKLILNPGPLEYLDDDFADDMIAWSEGRGAFPAAPNDPTAGPDQITV